VEQRLCVRVFLDGGLKSVENKPVVIAVANGIRDNAFLLV
jgi:hypothetical protein